MKIAVFVEGHAEMLFVVDLLKKYSHFDSRKIGYKSINLTADRFEEISSQSAGSHNSEYYYQIVNVNNDTLVTTKIKKSIADLASKGFQIVIGLRDVYGENYKKLTSNLQIVNDEIIRKMYETQCSLIQSDLIEVSLHFAVMEFEAWLLALMKTHAELGRHQAAEKNIAKNLEEIQEVETIYHPTTVLKKLMAKSGQKYVKKEKDLLSILSPLDLEVYERLRQSRQCPSYTSFLSRLLPSTLLPA